MKILKFVILFGVILMISGCANTQNDNAGNTENSVNTNTQVSTQKKDLKDIVGLSPKYSADYDVSASGQNIKMTMIYALPKFASITKTPQGDVKAIFDGSSVISCNNMQGPWQCFKMEVARPENIETENSIKSGAAKTAYLGACSHAGETGSNYEIETSGVKSTACYTSEGILLEIKTPQSTMVATKISKTVSDSDFTPPATPQDLSAMIPNGVPGYS